MELTTPQIDRIIETCSSILLVAIGALLTPWVTTIMENNRTKKSIKPQLLKLLHTFYLTKADLVVLANDRTALSFESRKAWDAKTSQKEITEEKRSDLEWYIEKYNSEINKLTDLIHEYNQKYAETVSDIQYYVSLVMIRYNKAKHKKLDELITPILIFNDRLINLANQGLEDIPEEETKKQVDDYLLELTNQRSKIIPEINSIL